jgi:hypothetical protein
LPTKNEIGEILSMVRGHYLRHPLIPADGTIYSYQQIRANSVSEMVNYCIEKKILDALVYLYKHWYEDKKSKIWMRSAKEESVCRYRTSMFAESHYRILKRDYFAQFGRPVICILLNELES